MGRDVRLEIVNSAHRAVREHAFANYTEGALRMSDVHRPFIHPWFADCSARRGIWVGLHCYAAKRNNGCGTGRGTDFPRSVVYRVCPQFVFVDNGRCRWIRRTVYGRRVHATHNAPSLLTP